MGYRNTRQLVDDLKRHQRLIVIEDCVDPHLELAEIHRRVYRSGGPALLFTDVKGCNFPVATNLFGTLDRARFIFRDTLEAVKAAVQAKIDPMVPLRKPKNWLRLPILAWHMRPKVVGHAAVGQNQCRLGQLPAVVCWPEDGGPFVTLPQVLSQAVGGRGLDRLNLGMYRIQLSGNSYVPDQECGLHYQIHRGIGVHHTQAIQQNVDLPVNVTVGGAPAMSVAAVMPLPEGMSELGFAGALAGHRIPVQLSVGQAPLYADADFAIVGRVVPGQVKPEGPFGDHLGYYAKVHDFPVLQVQKVLHRPGAIWPMTVVGRPPQEDTSFGELIHALTGPIIPTVLPGVREVHAVDAAGVHPLLLAVGSERYTPYVKPGRPQELLTQACAILGQGQLSLAKYLWIIDGHDTSAPPADQLLPFFTHHLSRVDWRRDLHFLTQTTIDTLDYTGDDLNQGSKLILAASGPPQRTLATEVSSDLRLPQGWDNAQVAMPGVLVVHTQPHRGSESQRQLQQQCDDFRSIESLRAWPLIVVVDDPDFAAKRLDNFLWVTFTRSNPAADVYGLGAFQRDKHFGCNGSLVIDARRKPQHSAGLVEDDATSKLVDARAARGGPLAAYL
jgi:4-hydroxy-3-polyprenylbenzoate decarboxylase